MDITDKMRTFVRAEDKYDAAYDRLIRSEVYEEEAELIDVYVSQLKSMLWGLHYSSYRKTALYCVGQVGRNMDYQEEARDMGLWIELLVAEYWERQHD